MTFKSGSINPQDISPPIVMMTSRAQKQLHLIKENDFTLKELVFRLEISGKDCHGFNYAAGFTPKRDDDFIVKIQNDQSGMLIHLDPFAAYYLSECSIDFIQDFEQDAEGFVIINLKQEMFQGKFWRASPELIPPQKSEH
jgi:Fe-S cluster assembly iron-binding protein IscA